jgi:hypothetical protein
MHRQEKRKRKKKLKCDIQCPVCLDSSLHRTPATCKTPSNTNTVVRAKRKKKERKNSLRAFVSNTQGNLRKKRGNLQRGRGWVSPRLVVTYLTRPFCCVLTLLTLRTPLTLAGVFSVFKRACLSGHSQSSSSVPSVLSSFFLEVGLRVPSVRRERNSGCLCVQCVCLSVCVCV